MGYWTTNKREWSSKNNGDKRITVLKDAEVELYNINTRSDTAYGNNIGNFTVITVAGSLKMQSYAPSIRTIISEKTSSKYNDGYNSTTANTKDGMATVNILEGATYIAESIGKGTYGAIYTYNTMFNIYRPYYVDINDMSSAVNNSFFYSGSNAPRSELNVYDVDMYAWNHKKTNTVTPDHQFEGTREMRLQGFYSFLGSGSGTLHAYNPSGLSNFRINNYSRLVMYGDMPYVKPDTKFHTATPNVFQFGNAEKEFTGKGMYGKKIGSELQPMTSGRAVLIKKNETNYVKQTNIDADGNWKFIFDPIKNPIKVGEYSLYVVDNRGITSDYVTVRVKDTIPPVGVTQLYKIQKGDDKSLIDPRNETLSDWYDETTPKEELRIYYNWADSGHRKRIYNTLGRQTVPVVIEDSSQNKTEINAEVFVYEGDPPNRALIEGQGFDINFDSFDKLNNQQKREKIIELGKVNAYLFYTDRTENITKDSDQFFVEWDTYTEHGGDIPVYLEIKENGKSLAKKEITMKMSTNLREFTVHQVELFYDDRIPSSPPLTVEMMQNSIPILTDFKEKERAKPITFYVPSSEYGIIIDIETLLKDKEKEGIITLDMPGYIRNDDPRFAYHYLNPKAGFTGPQSGYGTEVMYVVQRHEDYHIYIQYKPQTMLIDVPDLKYGDLTVTEQQEETHGLLRPKDTEPEAAKANKVTVLNTALKQNWDLTLVLEDNLIQNEKEEDFLGGLIYYENGIPKNISQNSQIIHRYSKSKDETEILTEIDFYSKEMDEGLRLKQKLGNNVGSYSGKLIWALIDGPSK